MKKKCVFKYKMAVSTVFIIEIIAVIFLLGVLGYIAVVIFGRSGGGGDGPPSQKCIGDQTYIPPYGCITCQTGDPTTCTSCSVSKNNCNGGNCISVLGDNGICSSCPDGYFGQNCEKECDANVQCSEGAQCVGGKCIGGSGCKCGPNQTCETGSTSCTKCIDGWGPGYVDGVLDCTKKSFIGPEQFPLECRHTSTTSSWLDTRCKDVYGPNASYNDSGKYYCSESSPCGWKEWQYLCTVDSYYADPTWNPGTSTCNAASGSYYFDNPYLPPGYYPTTL